MHAARALRLAASRWQLSCRSQMANSNLQASAGVVVDMFPRLVVNAHKPIAGEQWSLLVAGLGLSRSGCGLARLTSIS